MRLSSFLIPFAVLSTAGIASVGTSIIAVNKIESQTQHDVAFAMETQSHGWVDVTTDGLQVLLSGSAPTEAARFQALRAAGGVVDAARVVDGMTVVEAAIVPPPEFVIEILRNDDGISLIGLIPQSADRETVIASIKEIAGDTPVTDLLETSDHPTPEGWDVALTYGLDALKKLERAKISVSAERVEVTAISDTKAQKERLSAELARSRPESLRVALDISAPRPVITPFTLRFLIDEDGARFDACSAATPEGVQKIVKAANEAGLEGKVNCTVGLGVPSKTWPDAVTQSIAALAEIGGGSVTFSDADITLIAAQNTPQNKFDRAVGELESNLPPVFSLHSVLPEPEVDKPEGDVKPEFTATLSPEGELQLRGRIGSERSRIATESLARAKFGSEAVHPAMRLDENVPQGWPVRVIASLEALAQLNNGSVLVTEDNLEIKGTSGNKDASAEVSRILSDKLGASEAFEVSVRYDKKLDMTLGLPTPEECEQQINTALKVSKITFAPGSADIEPSAESTIDAIAATLQKCEDVPMEIAGHTDSQGREEMNQNLSQARAEAVLSALLSRRVLTSALTAKGYGESVPIEDNDTEAGREANRRIEFTLILPEETEKTDAGDVVTPDDAQPKDTQDQTGTADEQN